MFSCDPIWLLLNKFFRLNSRLGSLMFAVGIGSLTFFIIPFFSGYLFPMDERLASLEDWPGMIITFFTHPAIYLYYCFEQERIFTKFIDEFCNVYELDICQLFEETLRKTLNFKKWSLLAFLFTFIGYILHVQAVLAHPVLSYYYPNKFILLFINAPLSSLAGYMICLVVIRYLIVIVYLFRFYYKYKLKIYVLHPDGCGGLSFIGKLVFRSYILVAIMAIDLSLLILINLQQVSRDPLTDPSFLSLFGFYLIILPLSLVSLFLPRKQIQNTRREWQLFIKSGLDKQDKALAEAKTSILNSDEVEHILKMKAPYRSLNLSVIPIDKTTFVQLAFLIVISLIPIFYFISSIIFRGT